MATTASFDSNPLRPRSGSPVAAGSFLCMSDHGCSANTYAFMVSAVAATGGFLFGYDLAVVSGAIIFLQKQFALNTFQVGFAIGSAQIGCIFAPFFAGPVAD